MGEKGRRKEEKREEKREKKKTRKEGQEERISGEGKTATKKEKERGNLDKCRNFFFSKNATQADFLPH